MAGESGMRRAKVSLPHKATMKTLCCCGRSHAERKKTWTMPCKRKFCDHCGEFVSERTYRRHSDLKLLNQGLSSDEDESLVRQDNKVVMDFREEQDDEREVPGTRIKSAFTKCNNVLLFLFVRLK